MDSLAKRIGRTVRKLRAEKGFSQEAFADAVGVHRTYMGTTERAGANLTVDKLERIARVLQISVSELVAHAERER